MAVSEKKNSLVKIECPAHILTKEQDDWFWDYAVAQKSESRK